MPPAVIAVAAAVGAALAPTLAPVVLGVLGIAATTTAIAITAALITVAISVAAQVAISLTQGRKPTNSRTNQGEELKLKLDPGMPRQLPLGRCATGGSIVWSFIFGST